jgi:hypothetical protein
VPFGGSPGLQSGGAGLQADTAGKASASRSVTASGPRKQSHWKRRASALGYVLGLIAAAVGLIAVVFAVVDGIEQIEDLHLLAAPDVLIESRSHGLLLRSVMAYLESFLDQAIVNS